VSTIPPAPRTREQQFTFLRDAHNGPEVWERACLSLARQAPGLPGGIPSAHAAALLTPTAHRIHDVSRIRRGMVIYFANFHDDNPEDHVVTAAGWHQGQVTDSLADVLAWSNDIVRTGGVDLVRASRFPDDWNAPFWFAAISLNGFMLPGYKDPRATPDSPPPTIGHNLDDAIDAVRRAIRAQRAAGHPRRADALARDLAELKQTRAKYPRP
jgi:hypothetical protein